MRHVPIPALPRPSLLAILKRKRQPARRRFLRQRHPHFPEPLHRLRYRRPRHASRKTPDHPRPHLLSRIHRLPQTPPRFLSALAPIQRVPINPQRTHKCPRLLANRPNLPCHRHQWRNRPVLQRKRRLPALKPMLRHLANHLRRPLPSTHHRPNRRLHFHNLKNQIARSAASPACTLPPTESPPHPMPPPPPPIQSPD